MLSVTKHRRFQADLFAQHIDTNHLVPEQNYNPNNGFIK